MGEMSHSFNVTETVIAKRKKNVIANVLFDIRNKESLNYTAANHQVAI